MKRRNFLQLLSGAFGTALAARPLAVIAARQSQQPLSLSQAEWVALEAICEQILPPINGIGTQQTHCVNFIDKLLAREEKSLLPAYQEGLVALNSYTRQRWRAVFAELSVEHRIHALELLEDGDLSPWSSGEMTPAALFKTLYFHTLLGFLASPSFGGNHQSLGWKAIGFPGYFHEMGSISDKHVEGIGVGEPS